MRGSSSITLRLAKPYRFRSNHVQYHSVFARATKSSSVNYKPKSATDAVETGTLKFEEKDYDEALRLYKAALEMRPNDDEARAATYNAACVYVKTKQWKEAVENIKIAVNKYGLKVRVIYQDNDLRALRERREWLDIQDELAGVVKTSTKASLRAEAKSPFRLTRTFIFGAFGAAAALALLITAARLAAILSQGGDSPDLQAGPSRFVQGALQNLAVNSAGVALFTFLVRRDMKAQKAAEEVVEREESLGRLQVQMNSGRVVPILRLRGARRPLILAGSKGYLRKCQKEISKFRADFTDRGVCCTTLP